MRKHVYKKGDVVRVLVPKVVGRVGYPKEVWEYEPTDSKDLKIAEYILRGFSLEDAIKQVTEWDISPELYVDSRVKSLAAYFRAGQDGFGGKERSIHYDDLVYWPGARLSSFDLGRLDSTSFRPFETTVLSKRVVKTGTYYPPFSSGHGENYEYFPGGLDNMKTHVIITTEHGTFHSDHIEFVRKGEDVSTK